MNRNQLKQTNDLLYSSILDEASKERQVSSDDEFVKKFIDLWNSPISIYYQNTFNKIQEFINSIDLNHKGLSFFLKNNLSSVFFRKCDEVNSLLAFCHEQGFSIKEDMYLFSKVIADEINHEFMNLVGNPEITKVYTRFLSENSRWLARTSKKTQSINIKIDGSNESGDIFNIENYYHNSGIMLKIRDDLQYKEDAMYKMGCTNICKEISSTIDSIEKSFLLKRYGFHRVTISKLIKCLSSKINSELIYVKPITFPDALHKKDAYRFLQLCEKFPHEDNWQGPIFDHYAEIVWKDAEFSVLIGEIDTKSYFISYNFEE